ncbi:helix-turn-helix domain-containing protein [Streptomyces sp. MK7]|uniref:helix-turn-helix domain-containing protein n=1 Tax=Streptomyces sp. MK7 TaxID=3067635 RepID=UPI00292D680D|nr:helix-turn-helix domain-containing protein [Streptomyces sp. MK7]
MLHIHFTEADLARTRVATAPDPMWETLMATHRLAGRGRPAPCFLAWRERARAALTACGLVRATRLLLSVAPPLASYFPDFLTPPEGAAGLEAGLEALCATPRDRVRTEVMLTVRTAGAHRPTAFQRELAAGDREPLTETADIMRALYHETIEPDWTRVDAGVDADRALRARALRDGGVDGLLDSLRPAAVWDPPVLRSRYPVEYDLHLGGRGLLLIPSFFCWRNPIALADPALPPVLVYPIRHGEPRLPEGTRGASRVGALTRLLGPTRARVLAVLEHTATTGEIARRLAVSPATASEHVRALREAELAESLRDGGTVLHTLTPLGTALLHGGSCG